MVDIRPVDWSMIRGDTLSFNIEIEDLEVDLTSLTFTCRTYKGREIVFQKTLGDGCAKVETEDSTFAKYNVRVAPEDTAELSPGKYRIDLEIGWGTDVYTPIRGNLNILDDETY